VFVVNIKSTYNQHKKKHSKRTPQNKSIKHNNKNAISKTTTKTQKTHTENTCRKSFRTKIKVENAMKKTSLKQHQIVILQSAPPLPFRVSYSALCCVEAHAKNTTNTTDKNVRTTT
jgi:hypothetical protein